jgi:hypothetical protein
VIEGRFEWEELVTVAIAGVLRQVSALMRDRPPAHDCDERNAWTYHVNGAAAEAAVAKFTDRYWRPLARDALRRLPGDVAVGVQVRSTDRPDGGLIVHRSDPDDALFYLVVTDLPNYRIVGCLTGRDAKQERFWERGRQVLPHPAFLVPQNELHDVTEA